MAVKEVVVDDPCVGIYRRLIVSLLGRLLILFCSLALSANRAKLGIAACDAQCRNKADRQYAVEA